MIMLELFLLIGIITCFLKDSLVVMLSFSLLFFIIIGNIVNFDNLVKRQSRKYILNFENILNVIFCSLNK